MAKPIGTIGNIPTITVGGVTFVDLTNLIMLYGYVNVGTNPHSTLRKANASSGYLPSGSNKFRMNAVQAMVIASGTHNPVSIGYSDNDVGVSTNTAFINPVYLGGSSLLSPINTTALGQVASAPLNFLTPNTKYSFISNEGAGDSWGAVIYGYEEA